MTVLPSKFVEEIGVRPRVEVRTYVLNSKGDPEELSCFPIEHYGSCPNVGDTILNAGFEGDPSFYTVQRRYFVDEHDGFSGWGLLLREIDTTGPPRKVWDEWVDATQFWNEVYKKEISERREKIYQDVLERAVSKPSKGAKTVAKKPGIRKKPAHKKTKSESL